MSMLVILEVNESHKSIYSLISRSNCGHEKASYTTLLRHLL